MLVPDSLMGPKKPVIDVVLVVGISTITGLMLGALA
jgi:hypothetical protein